ncbi:MAG: hypothetical protein V3T72_19880 [Thermoanaerobaculia bacterium]
MRCSLLPILLPILCLAGTAGQAQLVPAGDEFQVSVDDTVDQDFIRRESPEVAVGPAGEFAVVWVFFPAGFQGRGFAADGTPGDEFVIAPSADARVPATDLAMTAAADGEFVVVWNGVEPGGTPLRPDTVGQRYAVDGTAVGEGLVATEGLETSRFRPAVAKGPSGELVVVWSGSEADEATSVFLDIRGRRYDPDGAAVGDVFQINTDTTGPQVVPAVAIGPGGDFLVVWRTVAAGGLGVGTDVHGRLYDAGGKPLTGEFAVNSYTLGSQTQPAVAAAPDGRFLVVWETSLSDGPDTSQASIRGQLYDSDGAAVGGELQVNSHAPRSQGNPTVAAGPEGGFVVAWEDAERSIRARVLAADASPLGDDFQVNTTADGVLGAPAVSVGSGSEAVIVWDHEGSEQRSLESSIRGRRFRLQPPPPCADARFLCLGDDGRFKVEVAWTDFAGGSGSGRRVGGSMRTADSGFFYFFDADNWEILIKILDGCGVNGHYWVFAAATTNVGYTITVTDTVTGQDRVYANALGTLPTAIADVEAFASCDP